MPRIVLATLACVAATAWADQCSFIARAGGQVSPRSGDCAMQTAGEAKNGTERCLSREGTQIAQFQWQNGKREGPGWYYDYNDQRLEINYRADIAHGAAKVFEKAGHLSCTMHFDEGKARGAVKKFYADGKLEQAWLFENGEQTDATIQLTPQGKLMQLRCAAHSITPEDVQPCGHDGKVSKVQLHDRKGVPYKGEQTYRDGKLIAMHTFDRKGNALERVFDAPSDEKNYVDTVLHGNGKVMRRYSIKDRRAHGQWQEFAEDGTPLEESVYERDRRVKQTLYYRNGNLKRTVAPSAQAKLLQVDDYWDSGKVKLSGTYQNARNWDDYLTPEGPLKEFREDGSLASETSFVDGERDGAARLYHRNQKVAIEYTYARGQLSKMTCFDSAGAVQLTEEYFDDGSRKSSSNLRTAEERAAAGICQAK